jgi:hypothetical protein
MENFYFYIGHTACLVSPCHQVSSGCGWKLWKVTANILNKQPQKIDNGWFFSLRVGHGANNHLLKKKLLTVSVEPRTWADFVV